MKHGFFTSENEDVWFAVLGHSYMRQNLQALAHYVRLVRYFRRVCRHLIISSP